MCSWSMLSTLARFFNAATFISSLINFLYAVSRQTVWCGVDSQEGLPSSFSFIFLLQTLIYIISISTQIGVISKMIQISKKATRLKEEGNLLYKKKQYQKAIEKYTDAIGISSNFVQAYSNRALSFIVLHKYRNALDDCEVALSINPRHTKTIARKGKALVRLLKINQAMQLMQKQSVHQKNHLYDQVMNQAIKIRQAFKEFIKWRGEQDFKKAYNSLALLPQTAKNAIEVNICKLQCLARTNPTQALSILQTLQNQINQTTFLYWYFRSIIQLQKGTKLKSKRYLQQSIRLHPTTYHTLEPIFPFLKFTRNQLVSLLQNIIKCENLLKEVSLIAEQPTKTRQLIRKLCQLVSINAISSQEKTKAVYLRSKSYNTTKEKPKELNDLNIVLSINPNYYDALKARFRFYQSEHRNEQALKDAQALTKLNPKYSYQVPKLKKQLKLKTKQQLSYYQILQLQQSATGEQIKKAYKQLAIIYHPDKNRGLNDEAQEFAQSKFKELKKAYECLSSPEKKQIYDLNKSDGEEGSAPNNEFNMSFMNLFRGFPKAEQFFGGFQF